MTRSRLRILVFEDDADDLLIFQRRLTSPVLSGRKQKIHFEIVSAATVEEGMRILENDTSFDAIILDLWLPDGHGTQTIETVKAQKVNVPIIAHTSLDDEEFAQQAIKAGADEYLVKGAETSEIRRVLLHSIERYQITEKLRVARKEALAAAKAKTTFLATMSHEIRTPLTAIMGFAEALANEQVTVDELAGATNCILSNAEHLLCIINDVLDYSKIEAGKLKTEPEPFRLVDLLSEIRSTFEKKAAENNLFFKVKLTSPIPSVIDNDPTRLKQILYNLIGNAIKFTVQGGIKVYVSCDIEHEKIHFAVADTGIGIPEDMQEDLFQPFVQFYKGSTRQFGGTGLGLAISKQLVESLGGCVDFKSSVGEGSVFYFTIDSGGLENAEYLEDLGSELRAHKSTWHSFVRMIKDQRILLAEDGRDNRLLISFIVRRCGAHLECVDNGKSAIEMALSQEFDLVLMDLHMPILDGISATKELRSRGYTGMIVALTADAFADTKGQCQTAGFDGYLAKPFKQQELRAVMKQAARQKELVRTCDVQAGFIEEDSLDRSQVLSEKDPLENDPEFKRIVSLFVQNLPERLQELQFLVSERNLPELQSLAHQMKGSAALYGFPDLSAASGSLEDDAKKTAAWGDIEAKLYAVAECIESCTERHVFNEMTSAEDASKPLAT